MKVLENFGGFILSNMWLFIVLFTVCIYVILPKTVTLDAKHWECMMAVPDGIDTRCIEYRYKGK